MASNNYEDQENRLPLQNRRKPFLQDTNHNRRPLNILSKTKLGSSISDLNSQDHKRTVLGNLNIGNNLALRIQPSRAVKCKNALPCNDENDSYKKQSSNSSNSSLSNCSSDNSNSSSSSFNQIDIPTLPCITTIPTFTIYEDTCDGSSVVQNSSSIASTNSSHYKDSTKITKNESSILEKQWNKSKSNNGSSKSSISLDDIPLPTVEQIKLPNITVTRSALVHRNVAPHCSAQTSPVGMDLSICEENLMSVVTPSPALLKVDHQKTLGEDLLQTREEQVWNVAEYADDIYKYLREAEICHKARSNYMLKQTDITTSMRWILVDWLVEVCEEYNLHTETLYLAVSYIDRFLSQMSVKRDKLQLVGTTAMFIASKYEEIYPPEVTQFAYITDNTYKVSQILRMEHLILKVLSFDMAVPTAHVFANQFAKMCKCSEETTHLALFICELSMLDSDPFLRYLPSLIAAASVTLASYIQGKDTSSWPASVAKATDYSLDDLRECYINLNRVLNRVHETKQHAIRDKYKSSKWNNVSSLSPREGFPWC